MVGRDSRIVLARLVARLEERAPYVTLADIEHAATRRRRVSLPPESVAGLVQSALEEMLLLRDRRTIFESAGQAYRAADVYRVNRRHPLVRGKLL